MRRCNPRRAATGWFLVLLAFSALLVPQEAFSQAAEIPAAYSAEQAQPASQRHPHPIWAVTVKREGYTISGLVTHTKGIAQPKYGIALFPGAPGIMKIREEDGRIKFEMVGNFLVRSSRHWLDEETVVVMVDAPSDNWSSFLQSFRETPRYGADVAALLEEVGRRTGVADWTFVGTSEGSISAFHAARMNPTLARRVILTASLFRAQDGRGLHQVRWQDLQTKLLWVHHEHDPCVATLYHEARAYARKTDAPLVTVRGGGPGKGALCQAFTAHGFVGVERETVAAMHSWVKTGAVPADVAPPAR